MTLSIAVLVMETTGAMQLIVPIMLVIFVSKIVGDFFNEGKDRSDVRHECIVLTTGRDFVSASFSLDPTRSSTGFQASTTPTFTSGAPRCSRRVASAPPTK